MALRIGKKELVDEFMEITGSEREAALGMLEAFGWDMDGAMVMFMEQKETNTSLPVPPQALADAGTSSVPPSPGIMYPLEAMERFSGGRSSSNSGGGDEDSPRNTNELDEFGIRQPDKIRRNQRLISSSQSSDAMYDDIMGRAEDENVDWMFPPPAHLSFAGNLDMAVSMAESDQKWLLINLQYHEEFSSHMLNREILGAMTQWSRLCEIASSSGSAVVHARRPRSTSASTRWTSPTCHKQPLLIHAPEPRLLT